MSKSDFLTIHEKFRPKILHYLSRLAGESEAEDLCQEVFVKIHNSLKDFRGDAGLSTWVYRIATNTAIDRLRSSHSRQVFQGTETLETGPDSEISARNTPLPDRQLIRKEMNRCIRKFILDLPTDYRAVLILSEYEELKNSEIAKILGLTLETVKIRLHRARARLKKSLGEHCEFYRDERNEFACDLKQTVIHFRRHS